MRRVHSLYGMSFRLRELSFVNTIYEKVDNHCIIKAWNILIGIDLKQPFTTEDLR